jgi:hypothetical protein
MDTFIKILLSIVEQPNSRKIYEDLRDFLQSVKRDKEAIAIQDLINKRYVANSPDIDKES